MFSRLPTVCCRYRSDYWRLSTVGRLRIRPTSTAVRSLHTGRSKTLRWLSSGSDAPSCSYACHRNVDIDRPIYQPQKYLDAVMCVWRLLNDPDQAAERTAIDENLLSHPNIAASSNNSIGIGLQLQKFDKGFVDCRRTAAKNQELFDARTPFHRIPVLGSASYADKEIVWK